MQTHQGSSTASDGAVAVQEATAEWPNTLAPDVVLVFASTTQDPHAVADALHSRFPQAHIVGCSTTGELLTGQHLHGSVVLTALSDTGIQWASVVLPPAAEFDEAAATSATDQLFEEVGWERGGFDPADGFCLSFLDGLSGAEERLTPLLGDALEGVALVGGSAGDDLKFEQTWVFGEGRAWPGRSVLLLGRTQAARFSLMKHQHFHPTPTRLTITECVPSERRITEIDGLPAAQAYAAAIGVDRAALSSDDFLRYPLAVRIQGEVYVRSVAAIHDDDSLSFFCAIDRGMVLEIGGHDPMAARLTEDLGEAFSTPPALLVACNCVLRATEADQRKLHTELNRVLAQGAQAVVGFDTYGEQIHGLHINQTLVGLALHADEEAACP